MSQYPINPANAEATFVKSTRMQKSLKIIETLSCWYSLDSSWWVLSDEYPSARVSVIFRFFGSFCIGQISHQQHKLYHWFSNNFDYFIVLIISTYLSIRQKGVHLKGFKVKSLLLDYTFYTNNNTLKKKPSYPFYYFIWYSRQHTLLRP